MKPLNRTSIVNWIDFAGSIGIFLPCSMKDCMREMKQIQKEGGHVSFIKSSTVCSLAFSCPIVFYWKMS